MRKQRLWIILVGVAMGGLSVTMGVCSKKATIKKDRAKQINSVEQVLDLWPQTSHEIETSCDIYIADAQKMIDAVIAVPDTRRTFANTCAPIDALEGEADVGIFMCQCYWLKEISPDEAIRAASQAAVKKISNFMTDAIGSNKKLYEAFKAYDEGNGTTEYLNDDQYYFLDALLRDFVRSGLELPDDQLAQVTTLDKALTDLSLTFDHNIAADDSFVFVNKDALVGLADDFIATLEVVDDQYKLGTDYPTYFMVMEKCAVSNTRKALQGAFNNRAYPKNESVLKEIIAKRDEKARLLGFSSFAHFNLDSQMVQTPERAEEFLRNLYKRSFQKEKLEVARIVNDLPDGVQLTKDGKLNSWDAGYASAEYKKKHYDIDETKIAEYFPMQKTIDGLLDIYTKFFSVTFEEVPVSGLWHEDVQLIKVLNQDKSDVLGYIFMDLYPRPNKYSHAACFGIIPALIRDGKANPSVVCVVANFTKATATKPSLLKRNQVQTFFHEFGHALHHIFGATELSSQAGTNVKRDFVEMPSQMLEEWLYDPHILKTYSSHYQTGEPIPDDLIAKIVELKSFSSGGFVSRQVGLSMQALEYYKAGSDKNPRAIMQNIYKEFRPLYVMQEDDNCYASWGHLTSYAAKYYGYLWSKVFALDLFAQIKKEGLLNPVAGKKYVYHVIGRGGTSDPDILLRNFLGREPNDKAFFSDMGL